jgi:hypothetical protein
MHQKQALALEIGMPGSAKVQQVFLILQKQRKNGHYPIIISLNFLSRGVGNITGIIKNIMSLMVELAQD